MKALKNFTKSIFFLLIVFSINAEAKYFGTLCQEDFYNSEKGKDESRPHAYTHCGRFNSKMDSIGSTDKRFYQTIDDWNEDGWTPSQDYRSSIGGLDTAAMVFVSTHGNSYKNYAVLSKYDGAHYSSNWEFGNNSKYLNILAMKSCSTMRIDSTQYTVKFDETGLNITDHGGTSSQWDRFKRILKAGTKLVLGAYDSMYSGSTHKNEGKNFANYLKSGHSLQYAWRRAYKNHHPNTLATGTSSSNCKSRRDNMKWSNSYSSYSRITGSNIKNFCQRYGF